MFDWHQPFVSIDADFTQRISNDMRVLEQFILCTLNLMSSCQMTVAATESSYTALRPWRMNIHRYARLVWKSFA